MFGYKEVLQDILKNLKNINMQLARIVMIMEKQSKSVEQSKTNAEEVLLQLISTMIPIKPAPEKERESQNGN